MCVARGGGGASGQKPLRVSFVKVLPAHPPAPRWPADLGPVLLTLPPPPPPFPSGCSPMQALMSNAFQADQHMHTSAWLGKLTHVPGPRGTALQQALLTCIAHAANSPKTGQGGGAGQSCGAGQGWRLVCRPIIAFAVALLEKGNVKAAELADALSGTACHRSSAATSTRLVVNFYNCGLEQLSMAMIVDTLFGTLAAVCAFCVPDAVLQSSQYTVLCLCPFVVFLPRQWPSSVVDPFMRPLLLQICLQICCLISTAYLLHPCHKHHAR